MISYLISLALCDTKTVFYPQRAGIPAGWYGSVQLIQEDQIISAFTAESLCLSLFHFYSSFITLSF